jgi:hypothetical protein
MPLEKVMKDGQECWRWGNQKLYCGKDAKKKALKQALAIIASQADEFKKKQEAGKL